MTIYLKTTKNGITTSISFACIGPARDYCAKLSRGWVEDEDGKGRTATNEATGETLVVSSKGGFCCLIRDLDLPAPLTPDEQEEIAYEKWVIAGGPEKAKIEHEALARESLTVLEGAGFKVLSEELVREAAHDFPVIEAVVRKGDELVLIRWQTFNRGWMQKMRSGGWVIFSPLKAPRELPAGLVEVEF